MTGPLRMSFEVRCPAEHAFAVGTSGIGHLVAGRSHHDGAGRSDGCDAGRGRGPDYERTRDGIEHRGWDCLGSRAGPWRDRNRAGWATLLPHFQAAISEPGR